MKHLPDPHVGAVAGLLLAAGLLAAAAPHGEAQPAGVYAIEGTVRDAGGDPVSGAQVTLVPANDSGEPRRTRTGEDGSYRFGNLSGGTYDLLADADCCGPDHRRTQVMGTTLEQQVDLSLGDQPEPAADETFILYGRTQAHDGGEAVPGVQVTVQLEGYARAASPTPPDDGYEHGEAERPPTFAVVSDDDGTYALELAQGEWELEARRDGYDVTQAQVEVRQDRRVDVPVRASATEAARLSGVVRSSDGGPLAGAEVSVRLASDSCEPDGCPDGDEVRRESDGVRFFIEPAARRYDWTTTASDGRWRLSVYPGSIEVEARAREHLPEARSLEVRGGESREVNLTLQAVPPASIGLHGTVTDAATGDPVQGALVDVRNEKWGTRNATRTDANGSYRIQVRPGYTVLRFSAPRETHPVCVRAVPEPVTDDEAGGATASSTVVRPAPCREPQLERERGYLPRFRTFVAGGDGDREVSPALVPAPARSATIQGWVLNASSGQEIPNVTVSLRNEVTDERAWARTDDDGSFAVNVTPGYYTLRAPARQRSPDHYPAVTNVQVGPNVTRTLALNLTPGTPRDRCCVVYGYSGASGTPDAREAAGGSSGGAPGTPASGVRSPGGGLGPYDPSKLGTTAGAASQGGGAATPGPGAAGVAGILAAAGALARGLRRQT